MNSEVNYIPLFTPNVPQSAIEAVSRTLNSRWIGQGPQVDEFEELLSKTFCGGDPGIAVGSGTDALHLAYLLAGIGPGDEVIVPIFTCTATNIPLLYIGAKLIFTDVDPVTMNVDFDHLSGLISEKTKAIVVVDFGGCPVDYVKLYTLIGERNIKVIQDAAHSIGGSHGGVSVGSIADFTIFSFQAIKHITTGDGGYLSFKDRDLLPMARRLRWFGIDRVSKSKGHWDNDIKEIGYKYQMTDISAAMGIAGLNEFPQTLELRKTLFRQYLSQLSSSNKVTVIADSNNYDGHAAWVFSIHVEKREKLQQKLIEQGIESSQVHYRNDRYSIFGSKIPNLKNMDKVEETYLVLPLHTKMAISDVDRICDVILND